MCGGRPGPTIRACRMTQRVRARGRRRRTHPAGTAARGIRAPRAHMLAIVSVSIVYLARHGPSASAPRGWLSAAEFRRYLDGYDAAGLMKAARVPGRLIEGAAPR